MNSKIDVEQCTKLIQETLSPIEARRFMADQLLFSLYAFNKLDGTISREASRQITNREPFLAALISYWAQTAIKAFSNWMQACDMCNKEQSDSAHSGWRSVHDDSFPVMEASTEQPMIVGLLGVSRWLEECVDPQDAVLLPQWIACLDLDYSTCADTALKVLTHLGEAARPALPALLERLARKGRCSNPFLDGIAVAAIAGHDHAFMGKMAKALTTDSSQKMIEAYCGVFDHLNQPPATCVDILLDTIRHFPLERDEAIQTLLTSTARMAKKASHKIPEIRQIAHHFMASDAPLLRTAATTALGEALLQEDEPLLIRLSQDPEWLVRSAAYLSAQNMPLPSDALVVATARGLGNYDGYDGYPHCNALQTLIHWGPLSAPALEIITQWLKDDGLSGYSDETEQTVALIENLGDIALPLLPMLKKFAAEWQQENSQEEEEEDYDDTGEDTPEEYAEAEAYDQKMATFARFAGEMGIDVEEEPESAPALEGFERLPALVKKLEALTKNT